MSGEIELVSDGENVVVAGDRAAIEKFLDHAGLLPAAREFSLKKLAPIVRSTGETAKAAAHVAEQSARYLKLTPESAARLEAAGGLMKTKTAGVSHAMLGQPGKGSLKWLQVEDGAGALLTNPAVLSGVGGLMTQFSQQLQAAELKSLLLAMDEKLDDVRRAQRDAVIAKMNRAAAAIDEAMTIYRHGGDPSTLWDKVSGESSVIFEVQSDALLALAALADKVEGKTKTGDLKKATRKIEFEVAVQLSILARSFELQDEFRVIELDHVLATAPASLDGHRLGAADAHRKRKEAVLEQTQHLMERMDAAGEIVNANVLLHAQAASKVINALNATADLVDAFHEPLGIETERDSLAVMSWRTAVRDKDQLKRAGVEVGQKALVAGATVAAVGVAVVGRKAPKP